MKIFISHSSSDKWAARRISKDLINLGSETFLDEKDIKTGESIDEKIQENLNDCDDLLILVSPASINSQWVLIELGGALALNKKIIPIFLYVGSNEIPKPISKLLGRDINDIDLYYTEVKSKIQGIPATDKFGLKKTTEIKTKFRVGDTIRLPSKPHINDLAPGWDDEMDKYLGLSAKIMEIKEDDGVPFAIVDIDDSEWGWALSWLVKIQ